LGGATAPCGACPAGEGYPTSTDKTCVMCGEGTYSAEGAMNCTRCPAGTWSSVRGAFDVSTCQKCTLGTWSSQQGAPSGSACQSCPAGRWGSEEGLTGSSACTACLPGSWSTTVGATTPAVCSPCPAGTWSGSRGASSAGSCNACPKGTWSSSLGASTPSSCSKCPQGSWSDRRGAVDASTCTACSAGKWGNSPGAASESNCIECSPGTWNDREGAGSQSNCRNAPQALGAPRVGLVQRALASLAMRASTSLQSVRPTRQCAFDVLQALTAPCRAPPLARHAPLAHGVGTSRPPLATSAQRASGRTRPARCGRAIAHHAWAQGAPGMQVRASPSRRSISPSQTCPPKSRWTFGPRTPRTSPRRAASTKARSLTCRARRPQCPSQRTGASVPSYLISPGPRRTNLRRSSTRTPSGACL